MEQTLRTNRMAQCNAQPLDDLFGSTKNLNDSEIFLLKLVKVIKVMVLFVKGVLTPNLHP